MLECFSEIAGFPSNLTDFVEHDSAGRCVEVHICGRFAVKFWDDHADLHVKVLDVHLADRMG